MNIQAITPEFIIETVGKYRWLLLLPILFCLSIGLFLSFTLPNIYEANTLILVEPQRVPSSYVQTIVSQDIGSRISTISEQILSRTNLEKIVQEFGLFAGEGHQNLYLEDKIDSMRKRIKVKLTRSREGADAFSISFKGSNPDRVMKIANTLANYFIDENLKVREDYAIGTSRFLEQELNDKRQKLEQTESRLVQYRSGHMGELPEQLSANIEMLNNLQKRLDNKKADLRALKSSLYDLSQTTDTMASTGLTNIPDISLGIDDSGTSSEPLELSQMKEELRSLKLRYTEKHPDVVRLNILIEKMEKQLEEQKFADQTNDKSQGDIDKQGGLGVNASELGLDFNSARKADLKKDIGTTQKEIDKIEAEIEDYRKRVANTPYHEQELIDIQRDYNNIKDSYNSLLSRKLESDIAVNMEKKQKGERFRILDYAKIPERPISPNLKIILLGSLFAGLGIGIGVIAAIELLKNTYFTPQELEDDLDIQVLGYVRPIILPKEDFYKKINFFASISVACLCVAIFLGMFIVTIKGKIQVIQYIENMFS